MVDARRDAGIGRYARHLTDALSDVAEVDLRLAQPSRPPRSESRPGRFIHAQPAALRAATRMKPDLVHGVGGEPVAGFPLARQVVTVHDVEMWRAGAAGELRDAALKAYGMTIAALIRECGAVIAVSRTSADEAVATLGLRRDRVHVVPEGVSPDFTPTRAAGDAEVLDDVGLVPDSYILWAGSLRQHDPRKGLDVLVGAVARLGSQGPALALAGSVGDEADRLLDLAARLGCRVVLCGRRTDTELAALYRNAAVFALASTHEGFGLAALEAMACGAPVVATAVGNLPDLCDGAALLVPSGDPAVIASGLRAVLGVGRRAETMRRAGVARAAAFTWERTAQETALVYRTLVADITDRRRSPNAAR